MADAPGAAERPRARHLTTLVAAGVLVLQILAMLGFCAYYLIRLARHDVGDSTRVLMTVVLLLLFAGLLALLARGVAARRAWPRTPTVLWQVLLLPVAWGLFQSGRADIGSLVLLLSVAGIVGVVLQSRTADQR